MGLLPFASTATTAFRCVNQYGIANGSQAWACWLQMQVHEQLLSSFDLAGVAEYIRSGRARRIVCMVGAGISVSAGIPGATPCNLACNLSCS